MTLERFLTLFERLDRLRSAREIRLFIQNDLKPLEDPSDSRYRDLIHAANQRLLYAKAAVRG